MAIRSLKTGQFSRSTLVGNPVIMPGSYESIATVSVGSGGASSVEFTSIPSTYTHLQIRGFMKLSTADNLILRMNSDTGTNYSWHYLFGSGSAASVGAGTSDTSIISTYDPNVANTYAAIVFDILDYANTNKNKTTRLLTGIDTNGGGNVAFYSGLWRSTSAITSLTFRTFGSYNISQYSHFALYGVN